MCRSCPCIGRHISEKKSGGRCPRTAPRDLCVVSVPTPSVPTPGVRVLFESCSSLVRVLFESCSSLVRGRLLPSDEKGMEVAPRPVPEDDLPFRPPVRVDLCSAVGTLLNPPDSVTYRGEPFVSRRRHSLHPHVTCGRQVPRPKKKRPGCGDPGTP